MEDETTLVLVPVPIQEASSLIDRLHTSGYQAVQFKGIDDVLEAIGLEPAQVGEVDLTMYGEIEVALRNLSNKPNDTVKALAYIGLMLTDIAQTHKRSMPPII